MHLVLNGLKGNTSEDAGCLDSFSRACLSMSCEEAVFEDLVQRVLDTGKALGRVVVLDMDLDVVVLHCLLNVL